MQIVEGGFNTEEINAAFDYDLVWSDDDSSFSGLSSSEESENGIDYEDHEEVTVIPPTPKKRKINDFVLPSEEQNYCNTCSQCGEQHVQGVSGINQPNICELSEQPTFNSTTERANNTSPHYMSAAEEHPACEHDKIAPSNTQPEHVITISLDTEFPPEPNQLDFNSHNQANILPSDNQNGNFPLLISTIDMETSHNHEHNTGTSNDNIDVGDEDDYYIIKYNRPLSPPPNHQLEGTQIPNCQGDTELQEDIENCWHKTTNNNPPHNH